MNGTSLGKQATMLFRLSVISQIDSLTLHEYLQSAYDCQLWLMTTESETEKLFPDLEVVFGPIHPWPSVSSGVQKSKWN